MENLMDGRQFFHLVMKEEYLSSPVEFVVDDALYENCKVLGIGVAVRVRVSTDIFI